MEFRPCIDIHNGKVKQIVGSSLSDEKDAAKENFVSNKNAAYYARLYQSHGLKGGHIILLNAADSPYYEKTKAEALSALAAFPGGMQVGGGVTAENASEYLKAGASHVIVTSYVFQNGEILLERLEKLKKAVGKEHIVLDLSARKYEDAYYVMTDRWQKKSSVKVNLNLLDQLSSYCDEYLIHAVDVEGKNNGIEEPLVEMLSACEDIPITYAGGIHSYDDLEILRKLGKNKIHATIGSSLDLFGGPLSFETICTLLKT
ncbi:MAG: phosphoribosylformimino-5-aminoimidazole carboxamide ribotide isomerase [Lachnospiraceae bacterium]|nr:phosphoribosylformimino-5-aminoimidazole carboxamide ribotide isomerase [Lachnospiraceae bacterium]